MDSSSYVQIFQLAEHGFIYLCILVVDGRMMVRKSVKLKPKPKKPKMDRLIQKSYISKVMHGRRSVLLRYEVTL